MEYKITLDGKKEVKRWFALKPQQIARASRLTINQVISESHKKLGGNIPREAGTSVVGYRRVRAKKTLAKARRKVMVGVAWMGTLQIPAKYAGRAKNTKGGVIVGRHFFENAFVATMKSGYTGVFRRVSGSRDIEQVMIDLPKARSQVESAATWAATQSKSILRDRLMTELNKKV